MYEKFFKRVFDIAVSTVAFFLLAPVMALAAVLIKVFDPGPVIFCQVRVGLDGNKFTFYKFRSMPVNTASVSSDKIGAISLSWVGRFLRRSNLDELPQLFNILKGDMSLVGPRPPIESQIELIELRRETGALSCRPGLTGLAQVNSFDGMSVEEKARFDAEYARNISFFGDVRIILKTFLYLLKPAPVY